MWSEIKGFEGHYQVSDDGQVKSMERTIIMKNGRRKTIHEHIMPQKDNGKGYKQVILSKDGNIYHKYIHRLVAEAFIPNPDNLPCINHIDEDRGNNKAENLEWCSYSYNVNYGNRLKKFISTITEMGYSTGEEAYKEKVRKIKEYGQRPEVKQRRKERDLSRREEINAWMREYRKRRKAEGRPLP